jgi:hypothetical protein
MFYLIFDIIAQLFALVNSLFRQIVPVSKGTPYDSIFYAKRKGGFQTRPYIYVKILSKGLPFDSCPN